MKGANIDGDTGDPLIISDGSTYLARGHLSPDADFVLDPQQDATYFFMNVAPQFQAFNNGNWKALENLVRSLASTSSAGLEVVTGTEGKLAVKAQKTNKDEELHLFENDNGDAFVDVPRHYWKVVFDRERNEAVAFVGYNDPHLQGEPEEMLCQNM